MQNHCLDCEISFLLACLVQTLLTATIGVRRTRRQISKLRTRKRNVKKGKEERISPSHCTSSPSRPIGTPTHGYRDAANDLGENQSISPGKEGKRRCESRNISPYAPERRRSSTFTSIITTTIGEVIHIIFFVLLQKRSHIALVSQHRYPHL